MTSPATIQEPSTDTKKHASRVIQLPISQTEWAALQAPFPLTADQWRQMLAVLEAMKPALVGEEANGRDPDSSPEGSD